MWRAAVATIPRSWPGSAIAAACPSPLSSRSDGTAMQRKPRLSVISRCVISEVCRQVFRKPQALMRRSAAAGYQGRLLLEQGACAYDESSRSEEHTSELQSLMRISYAVFCLKTQPTL